MGKRSIPVVTRRAEIAARQRTFEIARAEAIVAAVLVVSLCALLLMLGRGITV